MKSVDEDSPAAKAGIKEGDVVLEYNGQRVEGTEQFIRLVRETPPNRRSTLLISRNGATQTVTATIGTEKSGSRLTGKVRYANRPITSARSINIVISTGCRIAMSETGLPLSWFGRFVLTDTCFLIDLAQLSVIIR